MREHLITDYCNSSNPNTFERTKLLKLSTHLFQLVLSVRELLVKDGILQCASLLVQLLVLLELLFLLI